MTKKQLWKLQFKTHQNDILKSVAMTNASSRNDNQSPSLNDRLKNRQSRIGIPNFIVYSQIEQIQLRKKIKIYQNDNIQGTSK